MNPLPIDALQSALPPALLVLLPELLLAAAAVVLLLLKTVTPRADRWAVGLTVAASGAATAALMMQVPAAVAGMADPLGPMLLTHTPLTAFFRLLVGVSLTLTACLCLLTGLPGPRQAVDFCVLLLGATVGMMVTCGADHVLTFFLGVEMMSVPGYVLAGYFKARKSATEASLKYVIYGGGAAGIMLYGLSLLFGLAGGAGSFEAVAAALPGVFDFSAGLSPRSVTGLLATLMVLAGMAYKLSAVPFHFWCPDVFTGAPAEVGGFFSVASKLAALCLTLRFAALYDGTGGAVPVAMTLAAAGMASVTYGNLAAFPQTDAKRLLAYSTIAHAGFLLMGLAAALSVSGELRADAVAALLYYAFAYVFMNLAAFAVVAVLRRACGSTAFADWAGLGRRRTAGVVLGVAAAVTAFALVGLPPTAGFFAKLLVFGALWRAAEASPLMAAALVVGAVNTVVSLVYYLRLVRPLFFEKATGDERPAEVTGQEAAFVALLAAPLVWMLAPLGGVMLEFCRLAAP